MLFLCLLKSYYSYFLYNYEGDPVSVPLIKSQALWIYWLISRPVISSVKTNPATSSLTDYSRQGFELYK